MIDIRTITSNIGSVVNNYNDNISVLLIGDNIESTDDELDDLNFFRVGNYDKSNFKGKFKDTNFWDNLFEDFVAMDRTFDIIYLNMDNNDEVEEINKNKKLVDKISIILYNIIEEGIIIYPDSLKLNFKKENLLIESKNYNIYCTKKIENKKNNSWKDFIKNNQTKIGIINHFKEKYI